MIKKFRSCIFELGRKNHIWIIALLVTSVLSVDPVFADCKVEELSKNGSKLLRSGMGYEKNSTNYKACRVQNGGLLWALNLQSCDVSRIREKNPKSKLLRKMSRPELKVKRKIAELNYRRVNPILPSCKSISLEL